MPSKAYINKFPGGLDKDSDDKIKKNTTYKDAHHVELSGDDKYGALQNLKGTTLVSTILSSVTYSSVNVMGAFKARTFIVNDTDVEDCIYIFYAKDVSSVYTFVIDLFRPSNGITYNIFSSVEDSSIMSTSVDAFVIGEGGVDTLYFTTNLLPPGRIRCVLEVISYLTEREQELFKRYPQNPLYVSDIIYNPKSESAVSDTHTISWSTISETDTLTFKNWTGRAPFDVDTTAGDQFDVSVFWSLNLDVDESTSVSGHIYIYDVESGGISFTEAVTQGAGAGSYSNSGTRIVSRSGAYSADPIRAEVSVTIVSGSGYGFARSEVNISAITETAGGDTYLRGTPTGKTVQVTQIP